LKVALLGYGKMGQLIQNRASKFDIEVKTYFDIKNTLNAYEHRNLLSDVDVLIDFSIAEAVKDHVLICAELSKNIIIGTTGWHDQINEIKKIVKASNIGLIYGSNFSLGICLTYRVVDYASRLFQTFDQYDPYIHELHHKMKKDAPSGTAIEIKKIIKKAYQYNELQISSTRAGYIPGTHSVNFDSEEDSIKIEHMARSRQGFADGALLSVQWIHQKNGFYEFNDVLDKIISKKMLKKS